MKVVVDVVVVEVVVVLVVVVVEVVDVVTVEVVNVVVFIGLVATFEMNDNSTLLKNFTENILIIQYLLTCHRTCCQQKRTIHDQT